MSKIEITPLPVAVRVYPQIKQDEDRESTRSRRKWRRPDAIFVFDTETTIDASQRLTCGGYSFIVNGRCLEEGLFYGDDVTENDHRILEKYVRTHRANTAEGGNPELHLISRAEFVEKLYKAAYKGRCLLVAFNFPFDISRIASDVTEGRREFTGGFSLGLSSYVDDDGCVRPNRYRSRFGVKQIDSKRALKGFTARRNPDAVDLIPEGSLSGKPEDGYKFRGHILDLRTLAFALTDRGYTLEAACQAFGVEHGKQHVSMHGRITGIYIDYNRRDVLATSELAFKLLEEYDKHPIDLQETKAYSPASIGKAYLRKMGIRPILERQPNFPKEFLGYAQSAFFGGRTSAHIRKHPVPVVYTDFLAMYPTVNSLMDLWRFVIAREINVIESYKGKVEALLHGINAADLFNPATWKELTGFALVIPDGDILPSRGRYSESNDWQVAVNHLYASDATQALWYSLPDLVASVILTGRVPKIVDAFRIEARGILDGLQPVKLRGAIEIDPRRQDFFRVVIEQRKLLASRTDLSDIEKKRLDKALKVLANAASYGIYAEMNRKESDRKVEVICQGIDEQPFRCRVAHPDVSGEYCFPPLASLITGAARLMLGLLEHSVTSLGSTHAMEDTDSMAIVATGEGGLVPCPGGLHRMADGREAVMALSHEQVRGIQQNFSALNPYDRRAIPGSVLKIEDDNFDPVTRKQRQLYCLAISAKRYALYLKASEGEPVLLREGINNKDDRWSEHGLGHLLNPTDPESDDRDWIAQVWLNMIRRAERLPTTASTFANRPAVGRVTISSPAVMRPLKALNEGKAYADQLKPFNFLVAAHTSPFGHPDGADPEHFHLIAPYETDPRQWLKMKWIDQYSGKLYRITTSDLPRTKTTARVKTYGDVFLEYEFHPEAKCANANGLPSGKQDIGLLQRRHVRIENIKYIGKESNSLEEVEAGLVHSAQNVYTEYVDPQRDEWSTKILPALRQIGLKRLVELSGISRSALIEVLAGRSRPHRKNQERLATIAAGF